MISKIKKWADTHFEGGLFAFIVLIIGILALLIGFILAFYFGHLEVKKQETEAAILYDISVFIEDGEVLTYQGRKDSVVERDYGNILRFNTDTGFLDVYRSELLYVNYERVD